MMQNIDEIASMPHEIIQDKALPTQDHLYKLIIIGDTGKRQSNNQQRRRKELPPGEGHGQLV